MPTETVAAFAAQSKDSPMAPHAIQRRAPNDNDVVIDVLYCGVCHSDLHTVLNEWQATVYPAIPGHEIVGKVRSFGSAVKRFAVDEVVAVGCFVGSCGSCDSCQRECEQYCAKQVQTYNSPDPFLKDQRTYGGYSKRMVVEDHFVLKVPKALQAADKLPSVAPLLCAGITTFSPMNHWNVKDGKKVGIVGLGGLGHMALKFARARNCTVVLFTHSPSKADEGRRLGAHEVVISSDAEAMQKHASTFDYIMNTVSAEIEVAPYLQLLKVDGMFTQIGAPPAPLNVPATPLIFGRRTLNGSLVGGLRETQDMLDFCAEKDIVSDIELIKMEQINDAFQRVLKADVKYRFVIDVAGSKM